MFHLFVYKEIFYIDFIIHYSNERNTLSKLFYICFHSIFPYIESIDALFWVSGKNTELITEEGFT